ncbi:universal stress protein [Thiofilum flexile]|uniref:universal stress protein n=1 Tax=Thiofilum flexile TaxID=125627 RepID=UPI00037F0332|nr:universal stress protein [Thiofilum flexile]
MPEVRPFKTILYATNLGVNTRPVFRQAINLARIHKAKIIMLHVIAPLGSTGRAILSMYLPEKNISNVEQESLSQVADTMRQRLDKYCEEEDDILHDRDEIIDKIAVSAGDPAEVIKHYAETHNVDLIVMGTHANGKPKHSLLGSTARTLTQHSKIPVLLVPNSNS